MCARHKRRLFLESGAHIGKVLAVFLHPAQGAVKAANPVSRVAVPLVQVPFDEPIYDEIAYGLCHCSTFVGSTEITEKSSKYPLLKRLPSKSRSAFPVRLVTSPTNWSINTG